MKKIVLLWVLCLCSFYSYASGETLDLLLGAALLESLGKGSPLPEPIAAELEAGKSVEGIKVIGSVRGDLNGDGLADKGIALEMGDSSDPADPEKPAQRYVAVLIGQPDGSMKCVHSNGDLISNDSAQDVFAGIELKDGAFSVKRRGGGDGWRWTITMVFRYVEGQFRLAAVYRETTCDGADGVEITNYDFIRNKVKQRVVLQGEGREGPALLLYADKIKAGVCLFDEASALDIGIFLAPDIEHLPSLGAHKFPKFSEPPSLKISSAQALDKVKEKYCSDFEKVQLPLTAEMLKNYEKLLAYQVPDYYYQGKNGEELEYLALARVGGEAGESGVLEHGVKYKRPGAMLEIYRVNAADGKIGKW